MALTIPSRPWLALAAVLCGAWGWLLFHAHYFWGGESYYNFGWFVPLLAAFLLHRRIARIRPRASPAPGRARYGLLLAGLIAAATGVAFFRLFNEANPFWRVPLWGHAMMLLGFTSLALIVLCGWKGLRQLLFPCLFLMVALPWPWRIEQAVIHSLTGWITDLTVLVLNIVGHVPKPQC